MSRLEKVDASLVAKGEEIIKSRESELPEKMKDPVVRRKVALSLGIDAVWEECMAKLKRHEI
jgi:hypothetical protein